MDPPPAEGNFCDDSNHPVKHHIVERYNRHMGYIDSADCMANSYSMSHCTLFNKNPAAWNIVRPALEVT
jgi:hypothetical protein